MNRDTLKGWEEEIKLERSMPVARATTNNDFLHGSADVKCRNCKKLCNVLIVREQYLWSQYAECDVCKEKTSMIGTRYYPN